MKRMLIGLACIIGLPTMAEAKDPCASLMCLASMTGKGSYDHSCKQAKSDYFSIIKWGVFSPSVSRTSAARLKYLETCHGAMLPENQKIVLEITARWGWVIFE